MAVRADIVVRVSEPSGSKCGSVLIVIIVVIIIIIIKAQTDSQTQTVLSLLILGQFSLHTAHTLMMATTREKNQPFSSLTD